MGENSTLNYQDLTITDEELQKFIESEEFTGPSQKVLENITNYSKVLEVATNPKMNIQIILN